MQSDAELVRRLVEGREEGAFGEIVGRHVGVVYGMAVRLLGGSAARGGEAEDVVQAVFLLLWKKAGGIRRREALVAWLFQTTRYCCKEVRNREVRRKKIEREAAMERVARGEYVDPGIAIPGLGGGERAELAGVLDEALGRLGEKERAAILVRYMEGKTAAETGAMLGVSAEAVEKRVERGIGKMRGVLRKGFVVPMAGVVGVMMAEGAKGAPAGLGGSVVSGGGASGGASVKVFGIAKGASVMMKVAKLRTMVGVAVVVVMVGAGVMLLAEKIVGAALPVAASGPAITTSRAAGTRPASDPTAPTPAQLVTLVSGARERVSTLDVQYTVRRFNAVDGKVPGTPTATAEIHWLSTADRSRYHAEEHELDPADPIDKTVDITRAGNVSKSLLHHPVEGVMGLIRRGPGLMQMADTYPIKEPWVMLDWGVSDANSTVVRDRVSGLLTLTRYGPGGGIRQVAVIDPAHGFIPTEIVLYKVNGETFLHSTWTDLRQITPDVWVPFKVICEELPFGRYEYAVTACKVNAAIGREQLDLVLPAGTNVQDQIADRVYTIGRINREILPVLAATQPGTKVPASAVETLKMEAAADGAPESPAPAFDPRSLEPIVVDLHRGEEVSQVVTVVRKGKGPVGPLTITCPAHWATAEPLVAEVDGRQSFLLRIAPPKDAPLDPTQLAVEIAGADKGDGVKLPLFVTVVGDISAGPSPLLITPSQTAYHVRLQNFAAPAPALASFKCESAGLTVLKCVQDPADPAMLNLTVETPAATGFLSADLHLQFKNQPDAFVLHLCAYIAPH